MDADLRRSSGSLYRIDPDRTVERLFGGITVPNSTAFSPDDHRFYFADTPRHVIWVFDFDLDAGAISNRRVFADLRARSAMPDGSCVDSEGCLWNAEYGGHRLTRYAPDGRVIQTIDLPVTNPTCCCFGGDKLDTVFVTSAAPSPRANQPAPLPIEGGLLAVNVGVCGLPENAYGG